ncbi:hypothetical protein BU23DRAFT_559260 [Bimuria novae-zelandiae CBS 107.79]|uniref:RRM domain-containing protein n=1 Tax=Bimuria novae-zelandiae CBS 107.79 TaxID=1447943 RepID=A0A6A5UQY7_9PLEO|nr:hypothetical protein BU23DRAFT_559260 [Bimuria novae-zelandiae CBS 107.79]
MTLFRVGPTARALVSRACPPRVASSVLLSRRVTTYRRPFATTTRILQDLAQNDSFVSSQTPSSVVQAPGAISEELQRKNARSVLVSKIPRDCTSGPIKTMFEDARFNVVDIFVKLDRFRYQGTTYASVELADEEQAKRAIEMLQGNEALGNAVNLTAMPPDSDWQLHRTDRAYHYLVRDDEAGTRTAVLPLLEGRRIRISIKGPMWGSGPLGQRRATSLKVIERTYDQFGIESISLITPWMSKGYKTVQYLCHIDFTTAEGADEAIRATHKTLIDKTVIWAGKAVVGPIKASQIGSVNKNLLAELQEKGLAPPDSEIQEALEASKAKRAASESKAT